jgi:hypothetical protein
MNGKEKETEDPLKKWHRKNLRAILSNVRYKLLFLVADGVLIAFLFYLLSYTSQYTRDSAFDQIVVFVTFVLLFFFPFLYGWRGALQISLETSLNGAISGVRREIERIRKQKKDSRVLQVKLNNTRINLKEFINYSEIISPPVYNYELDRLQKRIDIFFNSVSEVLFSKPNVFSRAQKIEQQQSLDYYESVEHPTEEELEEHIEEMEKDMIGIIDWFDLYALDEFLQYLGNTLFAHTEAFSPFSYKHAVDLITLSRFFDHWNSVVSSCKNCRRTFEKAKNDVEEYYKLLGERETQHRQRMLRLIDAVAVVIASVVLSTIVGYLIK